VMHNTCFSEGEELLLCGAVLFLVQPWGGGGEGAGKHGSSTRAGEHGGSARAGEHGSSTL
jgi:hypothetical protein